jgi:elongation factor P--(R)-beta-lysine ligase
MANLVAHKVRLQLQQRARLMRCIRAYMHAHSVLEVDTPLLSRFGNTDPSIESLCLDAPGHASKQLWLRTSPEFFHKRLLAAASGDIFEIGKVFRAEEHSSRHRVEFSMLEYYRLGFDEHALMADVALLMQQLQAEFGQSPWPVQKTTFAQWFYAGLGLDIFSASDAALLDCAHAHGAQGAHARDVCLDFLRSQVLERQFAPECWHFIYDFPASQAALARVHADGRTASRFELFGAGLELGNGYFELTNPLEQRARFAADQAVREARGQRSVAMDEDFLQALAQGLPDCSGVAIGLDRVLMVLIGSRDIQDVLAF